MATSSYEQEKFRATRQSLPRDRYRSALEIGCGMGRLTLPHAAHFKEVVAVDISATMLKELNKKAEEEGLCNIQTFERQSSWDNGPISYAYSYLVFQHIADLCEIKNYLEKIAGCLKKNGIAQFQFDTRAPDMPYRLRNYVPDALLPKNQKKGIRRLRRDAAALRSIFRENDMEIIDEIGA
jgi:cyclopropane fatty-acyl-phospholipid synthase-like methyltransferase